MKKLLAVICTTFALGAAYAGGPGHGHRHHNHHHHRGHGVHWGHVAAGAIVGAAVYGAYRNYNPQPPAVVYYPPVSVSPAPVYVERPQVCGEWYWAQDQWGRQFWHRNCY